MCRWEPGGKRASWSVLSISPSGCRLAPPGGKCWGSGDSEFRRLDDVFNPAKYTHFVVAERGVEAKSPPWQRRGRLRPLKRCREATLVGRRRGGSFKRNCLGV